MPLYIYGVVHIPVLSTLQRLESERVTSEVATSKNTSHFVLLHDVFTYLHFRSKETTKVEILTFLQTFVIVMHSISHPSLVFSPQPGSPKFVLVRTYLNHVMNAPQAFPVFRLSSALVYYSEREWNIKTGEAWEQDHDLSC